MPACVVIVVAVAPAGATTTAAGDVVVLTVVELIALDAALELNVVTEVEKMLDDEVANDVRVVEDA